LFDTVIVGVDGREGGRDAILLASRLVSDDGRLILTHVYPDPRARGAGATEADTAGARDISRRLLAEERHTADIVAELHPHGDVSVGRGLHRVVAELEADLLVVGSCHRGPAGRVLAGDDARAGLDGAECAVALAPRGYARARADFSLVGVGLDGGDESEAALAMGQSIAARAGARVHALGVLSPTPATFVAAPFGVPLVWEDVLQDELVAAQEEMDARPGVEGDVLAGTAATELELLSKSVGLLVVGSRGYGPLGRLVLGSVSDHLTRSAGCPLLVMPRRAAIARPWTEGATAGTVAG
jgi:nucleotide-binding universal stress UspA family protein